MRFLDLNPLCLGESGFPGQPGISTFQAGKWLHGNDAFAHCRQDPQSARFTVWEQLSLDPAGLPGGMRHLADLATGQLQMLCSEPSRDCWTIFTPVHWHKAQLQVFLGVAAACKMDVRMLLPRVLAANPTLGEEEETLVAWEWQWNHLYRVTLSREEQGLRVQNAHPVAEGGVLDFFRRQSRAAAKWALETQRIDPLYSGETEQQLFESWWEWQQGNANWIFKTGEVTLQVSEQEMLGAGVHQVWAGQQDLPETGDGAYPATLAHALGWSTAGVERSDLQAVEKRLGDCSQPGARWKETLSPSESVESPTELPVTHWVVDGIAETLRGDVAGLRPGMRQTLEDGREGLAVHVPEK